MAVWIALGASFMGLLTMALALFAANSAKKKQSDNHDAR